MKLLTLFALGLFSSLVYASDDFALIDIDVEAQPLSEVVELINSKCPGEIDPASIENPFALLSLNFEQIPCEIAASVVRDFDSERKKTK